MPGKSKTRNWRDVQTSIAATAIVITLGLWNLFATPSKVEAVQSSDPVPPPTEPPIDSAPAVMPQVKIMFTQTAPQSSVVQQVQPAKKKKNKNKNDGGGSVSVTQTKSS